MFDIGWPEFFLAACVALVAIGPKDLPRAMHGLGVWAGKIRRFIYGLQHDFDRLTYEAEQIERQKYNPKNASPKDKPTEGPDE